MGAYRAALPSSCLRRNAMSWYSRCHEMSVPPPLSSTPLTAGRLPRKPLPTTCNHVPKSMQTQTVSALLSPSSLDFLGRLVVLRYKCVSLHETCWTQFARIPALRRGSAESGHSPEAASGHDGLPNILWTPQRLDPAASKGAPKNAPIKGWLPRNSNVHRWKWRTNSCSRFLAIISP
jgi:hypothetical protein